MTINFSLILKYPDKKGCKNINSANEGVLLRGDTLNSSHFLHFYYSNNNFMSSSKGKGKGRPLLVQDLNEGNLLRLIYNIDASSSIEVPGTLNEGIGLLNFSLNNSQLVNRMVKLKWEQIPGSHNCDVWSLDNVVVTLHHNNCTRNVFSDDFEDQK